MDQIFSLLNATLTFFMNSTGDWVLAIILLTLLIKTLFLPLTWKQKKAMQKQQIVSQKINELKIKHAKDKVLLNQEIAKVMQQHGAGLAAFLPLLLQMPVFYLLYKLLVSVASGSATKIIPWIANLNLPDPYFIMPLLCVVGQLLPNLLSLSGMVKSKSLHAGNKPVAVVGAVVGFLFMFQAPVALAVYWAVSALYSSVETLLFSHLEQKKMCTSQ